MLFEMVVGRKLIEGDSAFTIMKAHCQQPPTHPRSIELSIPRAIEEIILKALAKSPEERFQLADEFFRAIQMARPRRKYGPVP